MRKYMALFMTLVLLCGILAGCGGKPGAGEKNPPASQTENQTREESSNNGSTSNEKGLTLKQIRKAAEDAGYNVTDEYQAAFMKEVTGGFTVQVVADNQDTLYSILECKTEEAAIKNAKDIDDAGYNISVRNGKILGCYDVKTKDGQTKDIITSIVAGKPIPNNKP